MYTRFRPSWGRFGNVCGKGDKSWQEPPGQTLIVCLFLHSLHSDILQAITQDVLFVWETIVNSLGLELVNINVHCENEVMI